MNRWLSLALAGVFALALSGCVDRAAQQQAKATQQIVSDPTQVITVQPVLAESVSATLAITGQVVTGDIADVGAKMSGKLVSVYVRDGDPVVAGQVIATQDTSALQAQLRQAQAGLQQASSQLSQAISNAKVGPSKSAAAVRAAQAQLKSAQANLAKVRSGARSEERAQVEQQVRAAKANLDTAQKNLDRITTLVNEGAVARQQLDQAQNQYAAALSQYNSALQTQAIQVNGARPEDISVAEEAVRSAREQVSQAQAQQRLDVLYGDQVRGAQAQVNSARAQVDVVQQSIEDARIRAPFSGRISGRPAQPGQVVGPGSIVAKVVGQGGAYFEGEVPESEISKITVGSPVEVRISAAGNRVFAGRVSAVDPLGSNVGRLFKVRIGFLTLTPEIKPGMFASGEITLSTIPSAIMVPSTAVVNYKDQQVVWVMSSDTSVKPLPVQVGMRKGDKVQIVSGLTAGERLVVRGQEKLNDKSKVRIEAAKTAAGANPSIAEG